VLLSNPHITKEFLIDSANSQQLFSDQQLIYRKNAMAEAITLLWLSSVKT
jgi:hypothetical protein